MYCEKHLNEFFLHASMQLVVNEYNRVLDELKQLHVQNEIQLREERSKNATLLQALEGAPLKTEVSPLEDIHKLGLQLQQAERNIKASLTPTENKGSISDCIDILKI